MTRPVRVRPLMPWGPGDEIDAWPTPVPGLVIHRAVNQDGWTVSMSPSGAGVAPGVPDPEAALACAIELGPLTDWTRPLDYDALTPLAQPVVWRYQAKNLVGLSAEQARAAGAIL